MTNRKTELYIHMLIKNKVRQTVENEVSKEIRRIEVYRKKLYGILWGAAIICLACFGISVWQEGVPQVVASLIRKPASGQLAEVFHKGQINATRLDKLSHTAQEKIDDLSQKLVKMDAALHKAQDLSTNVASQSKQSKEIVDNATSDVEKIHELQSELRSEIDNSKTTLAKLQQNLVITEKLGIEIQYLQYASRNIFPSPYHQKILDDLNKMLNIAIPDPIKKDQFISHLLLSKKRAI